MAPAHEDDVARGERRRGRRNLSWPVTLFCFDSRRARGDEASSAAEGTTTPWDQWSSPRRRRKKRTVPVVDGNLVATAADSEAMRHGTGSDEEESRKRKGLWLPRCSCFLAPAARAPAREHSAMDSGGGGRRSKQRHPERTEQPPPPRWRRSQSDKSSPSEASSQIQATGGSNNSDGSGSRGAEQPRSAGPPSETTTATLTGTEPSKTTGAGGGEGATSFGPVVGLYVVVAVSMAGLLGGRLWAVACVCAWLAALSRLRRKEATTAAGEVVAVDVDSADHTEAVVLQGLLQRDRRSKAVVAAA